MSAPYSIGHSFDDVGRAFDVCAMTVAEIFIRTESGRPTLCEYPDTSDGSTLGDLLRSVYQSLPGIRESLPSIRALQTNADEERDMRTTKTTTFLTNAQDIMRDFRSAQRDLRNAHEE